MLLTLYTHVYVYTQWDVVTSWQTMGSYFENEMFICFAFAWNSFSIASYTELYENETAANDALVYTHF